MESNEKARRLEKFRVRLRPWAGSSAVPIGCLLLAAVVIWKVFPAPAGDVDIAVESIVLRFFRALKENLPLTLPLLSTMLSLMLNFRDLIKPHGWLKIALPASLGLVSFSIWYVVATQSSVEKFLRIGESKVLSRDYAVLLLVVGFIWAGFTAIGRVLGESTPELERGWRWYGAQALLLTVSLVGLAVPFFLFESKSAVEARLNRSLDEADFSVAVPYRDASLDQHLGRVQDPVTQCEVVQVRARTADEAVDRAREVFLATPLASQKYGRDALLRKVEIFESWIVAEPRSKAR